MSFRLTGLMAVLLLLFGGYYYLFEVRGTTEREEAAAAAFRMLPLADGTVNRLALRFADSTVVAERRPEGWRILEPVRTPANSIEIEFILRNLRYLANEQVVADAARIREGRVHLSDFGLEKPDDFIAIGRVDGSADTLFWGDPSPTGSYHYVRRSGTMDVMTARAWGRQPFERGLFNLRDRRIASVVPDSVRRIEICLEGGRLVVSRADGAWKLLCPVEDLGDTAAIERLVRRLSMARASGIAAEKLTDPDAFGLAEPRLTITLDQGPSLGLEQVVVGKRVRAGRRAPSYAWNPELAPVFQVDDALVRDVAKSPSDLRYRQIFGFDKSGIDRVRLEKRDGVVECRRDSVYGDWVVVEPKMQTVDGPTVPAFIHNLWQLTAKAFVSERLDAPERWGLDTLTARATLWRNGELVREIRVGTKDRRIYAKADHRPEVVELAPSDAAKLNLELIPVAMKGVAPDTIRLGPPGGTP